MNVANVPVERPSNAFIDCTASRWTNFIHFLRLSASDSGANECLAVLSHTSFHYRIRQVTRCSKSSGTRKVSFYEDVFYQFRGNVHKSCLHLLARNISCLLKKPCVSLKTYTLMRCFPSRFSGLSDTSCLHGLNL